MIIRKLWFIGSMLVLVVPIGLCIYYYQQIKATAAEKPPANVGHVIVLGAKVNGTEMSLSLQYRVSKALDYLKENPEAKVIVSGGQGSGEDITEAEAMKRFFIENGISKDHILVEDESTSTYENIIFSKQKFNIKEAVIVTSDFHLYRAKKLAEKQGIKTYPLAAPTPEITKVQAYIREFAAITKMFLTGK
ncbi:YdcF family protein [Bacillus sp. FJAT-42315]|uniref:YdcF family protein n=1 Tax=Bacillus sp. FJAT-42315 TaxID=2014077 RepID=UPI001E4802CF|nr:YdcF family protein [Bacillus sp. FJAT-42315]